MHTVAMEGVSFSSQVLSLPPIAKQRGHRMVRCWNCEHLIRIYSGKTRKGRLFENEYRKCKVKGIVYERYSDYTKETECKDYKESKHKIKYEEILELRKETFHVG